MPYCRNGFGPAASPAGRWEDGMGLLTVIDEPVQDAVGQLQQPWLDAVLSALTHLGDGLVIVTVILPAVIAFWALRRGPGRGRTGFVLAAVVALSFVTTSVVKVLVDRERPEVAWRHVALPESRSFPSGHALESTTAYGSLALLVARRLRRQAVRIAVVAAGFALAALVGVSRVYLGVHFCTDVLAGWAIGTALALTAWWVDRASSRPRGVVQ
jgi:undecaprenyl-diphosphatase